MDERRWRHWRRFLPGGTAYGDPSQLVAVLVVVWMARVQWLRRCTWSLCWGEVQRAHGCCMPRAGALGAVVASVTAWHMRCSQSRAVSSAAGGEVPVHFKVVARRSVGRWERRGPRTVARIRVFQWCYDGNFLLKQGWIRGINGPVCAACCVGPVVEEFW